MSKNILKEELNQMKYLFGYKPGKVISEQTKPNVVPTEAPANELLKSILTAESAGLNYTQSPYFPRKIVSNFSTSKDNGLWYISFTVSAPTDKKTVGNIYYINVSSKDPQKKIQSKEEINLNNLPNLMATPPQPFPSTMPTNPMDMAEIMWYNQGNKNPKAYWDFLAQLEPKSQDWLKNALMARLQRTTTYENLLDDINEVQRVINDLGLAKTNQPQTQTPK